MAQLVLINTIHVFLEYQYTVEHCEGGLFNIINSQGQSVLIEVDMNDSNDPFGFAELVKNDRWADFIERVDSIGYLEFEE